MVGAPAPSPIQTSPRESTARLPPRFSRSGTEKGRSGWIEVAPIGEQASSPAGTSGKTS